MNNDIIVVRGGGDIATGTIHKLYRCGFKVVILEIENPSSIKFFVEVSGSMNGFFRANKPVVQR